MTPEVESKRPQQPVKHENRLHFIINQISIILVAALLQIRATSFTWRLECPMGHVTPLELIFCLEEMAVR